MSRSKADSSSSEISLLQILMAVVTSLVTTLLTVGVAVWQFNQTNLRSDQTRFVDAAQATAQETSVLLDDGYTALDKLVNASGSDGWKPFSKGAWHDYMEFHRHWHQQLVAEHFKLARYFGKDAADQILHIDEIDIHPVNNLSSPNPCTPPGDKADFDIEKLANQTECVTRIIALEQDAIDDATSDKKGSGVVDAISARRNEIEFAGKLLANYDTSMVSYLRALDERLTLLGQPQVKVLHAAAAGR
jgi:hypothetical protein